MHLGYCSSVELAVPVVWVAVLADIDIACAALGTAVTAEVPAADTADDQHAAATLSAPIK